ncbi:MAG: hypothetical protein ACEQSA_04400 [Weeksellaceae bacterium]
MVFIIYGLVLVCFSIYSYALIDPNLTLVSHPLWQQLREPLIQLGYHQRATSTQIYLILLVALFAIHLWLVHKKKNINPIHISILVACIAVFAYPFVSHDLFNYIFDAKILTVYGDNPYMQKALDYPLDEWTRFMHWTHRPYPYGPTFLPFTLIPSYLSFNTFILNFGFFKIAWGLMYLVSVYLLSKLHKRSALMFATHPLVILEGLMNSHNDLIAVAFGIIGIWFLFQKNQIAARIWFLISGGIKYLTLPLIVLQQKKDHWLNVVSLAGHITLLIYLSTLEIQPWYFLVLFMFLPFYPRLIDCIQIFLISLLLSYYPYIMLGGWDTPDKVILKHQIIWVGFILNVVYLVWKYLKASPAKRASVYAFLSEEAHT